jgi:hypothetical protein
MPRSTSKRTLVNAGVRCVPIVASGVAAIAHPRLGANEMIGLAVRLHVDYCPSRG